MRKIICFLIIVLFIFTPLSGCNNNDKKGDNDVRKVLSDVYSIEITDVAADMYSSPLQISLSEAEVKMLIEALDNAPEKKTSFTGYLYYSFVLYDKENQQVDKITIDTQKTIRFDSGITLDRTEQLNSVIKSIEYKHNISLDIWDRKPSNGYFALFNLVDHGQLYEITENNFVDGLKFDLTKGECSDIVKQITDFSFSDDIIEYIDKKYVFDFYTVDGATVYILYLDKNGDVYTEQGYKVDCETLKFKLESLVVS